MNDVKNAARYSSPLRAQQAAATRQAVLDAARELFVAQGYGATTVEQIASLAGVSKPTVFTAVGNKQTLLATVRDVAMAGDDDEVPIADRPLAQRIFAEPDQQRALEMLAALIAGIGRRYSAVDAVLRGAAQSGEPGLRELWQTSEDQRLAGARMWASTLMEKGPLRAGLDPASAVDVLWLFMAPDHYQRLVQVRGWSDDRFRTWLAETLSEQLLPRRGGTGAQASQSTASRAMSGGTECPPENSR